MSITNTIQLVDLHEKSLHTEKSADVIQEKIRQKHVAEANRLFQESAVEMEKDDRERISKQLSALVEQAEKYFREADTLETERKLELAREKYKKVEDIAIDYPELPEALRRVDDAITLVRALEHRAKRRMSRQDNQPALLTTSSQSGRYREWLPLFACFSLLLIMVGAGLFYTDNFYLTFTEKDKTTALQQQTRKKALSKEEEGKQQKLSEQAAGSTRKKRTVSFTELQLNRKESLSPVPVSFLQMEKKIGDTSSAEGEFTIHQDIQPTADIVRRPEETMGEKSTPQLQDYVANRITVDDSEQPQQTKPEVKQQDESPFEMSSSRKNSVESVYSVQPGDTLGFISLKVYGISSKWSAIANANKDQLANNPDGLRVGMTLAIPTFSETGNVPLSPGSSTSLLVLNEDGTYTVQSGDSLGIISQKLFGTVQKWKKIYELNNDVLTAPHKLKVGQILRVKASGPIKETIESSEPEPGEERPAVLFSMFGAGPSDYIDSQ